MSGTPMMGTTPERYVSWQRRRNTEWEKLPPAPPLVPKAALTALDYARRCWRRECWGEPLNYGQERMWTLFFTSQEPHEMLIQKSWTRPDRWVEDLIRYPYPPRRRVHREVVLAI